MFLNLFPCFREHPVVSKLKQDSCHEVHASLYSVSLILILSPFYFICVQIEHEILSPSFHYRLFPIITETGQGTEKVLLMKFEILGLES